MVSVAISGFSADTSKLWKDLVSSSLGSLPSPTLKSIFAFLACDDEAYKEVLSVNNLDFVDRMAVAHIFLSDNLLKEYLEKVGILYDINIKNRRYPSEQMSIELHPYFLID